MCFAVVCFIMANSWKIPWKIHLLLNNSFYKSKMERHLTLIYIWKGATCLIMADQQIKPKEIKANSDLLFTQSTTWLTSNSFHKELRNQGKSADERMPSKFISCEKWVISHLNCKSDFHPSYCRCYRDIHGFFLFSSIIWKISGQHISKIMQFLLFTFT